MAVHQSDPTFGEWLRRQRRARDLTQEQLAVRLGCTASMLKKVEAGSRTASESLQDRARAWVAQDLAGDTSSLSGTEATPLPNPVSKAGPGDFVVLTGQRRASGSVVTYDKIVGNELETVLPDPEVAIALHVGLVGHQGSVAGLVEYTEALLSRARPGRIVLSNAASVVLNTDGVHIVRPFGRVTHHSRTEACYVLASSAAAETAPGDPANLPLLSGPTFGRESLIDSLCEMLTNDERSTVTLTGPGGIGKTRVAVEAAKLLRPRFPDGVVFLDLSPAKSVSEAVVALARATDLALNDGPDLLDNVLSALTHTRALCVVDNAEQINGIGPFVDRLASETGMKVLVTSRRPLRTPYEQLVSVPALALDVANGANGAVETSPAVAFLASCAASVGAPFNDPDGAQALCNVLDGIPLAIEMAAPRLFGYAPSVLAGLLEECLDLLDPATTDRGKGLRSLSATINWSLSLLSADAKKVFDCAVAFETPWRGEDLLSVVSHRFPDGQLSSAVLSEALHELASAHLVIVDREHDLFRLRTTVRAFARGSSDPKVADAHAAYFFAHVLSLAEGVRRGDEMAISALGTRFPDVREAMRWAASESGRHRMSEAAFCLGKALRTWFALGLSRDACELAEPFLAQRDFLNPEDAGVLLNGIGTLKGMHGDESAYDLLDEAQQIFHRLGNVERQTAALANVGAVGAHLGHFERSRSASTKCLAIAKANGDQRNTAVSLGNLGIVERNLGELTAARKHLEESAKILREIRDHYLLANALSELASVHFSLGDLAGAESTLRESSKMHASFGNIAEFAFSLERAAELALVRRVRRNVAVRAAQLIGAAHVLRVGTGVAPEPDARVERTRQRAMRVLSQQDWETGIRSGHLMGWDQALSILEETLSMRPDATELTASETAVLRLAADGYTNDQIARSLNTSPATTRRHLQSIFVKLGVTNRAAAVRTATARELL